jgi:pimeloyl-ACP methyl ester carboxylesterase
VSGRPEARPFEVAVADDLRIRGEAVGEGAPVCLLHGLTATRGYVVHGSLTLPREGFRQITYDARAHGESDAPGAEGALGYEAMVADLARVLSAEAGEGPVVLGGHSMGAHTAAAFALEHPERVAGLVLIGPVYLGAYGGEDLERWDRLADGLDEGGIDGFLDVVAEGMDPAWRDTVVRFTRERMTKHRHLDAMARALREVPRSRPFDSADELEHLDVPALVVASHDAADPHHPYSVAEAYAARLPQGRLTSEAEGESPLAWQGGRLAREIAAFAGEDGVRERLG